MGLTEGYKLSQGQTWNQFAGITGTSPELPFNSSEDRARCWWLTPIILATQDQSRTILVGIQTGQIVHETLSQKNPSQKRAGGVAQGVGPEFKPQYCKNKQNFKKFRECYRCDIRVKKLTDLAV
jgi:hypothetical protein